MGLWPHARYLNLTLRLRAQWKTFKNDRTVSQDKERARQLFEQIDVDGSGSLDREELADLAERLGAALKPAELDEAMAEMDENGDNCIDLDEFMRWWQGARNTGAKWDVMINRQERIVQEKERLQEVFDRIDTVSTACTLRQPIFTTCT